jgi:hypothetical protein
MSGRNGAIMIGAENVRFEPSTQEGDPGKLAYLHDANWKGKPTSMMTGIKVDRRSCPGCVFGTPVGGKWPHVKDARCKLFGGSQ